VAEVNGQGIPLGFILTTNINKTAQPGAKTRVLTDFLLFFKSRLPQLKFTITDKEMAEIEAFDRVWPECKHQTCYWHAIRTVEERLAENRPPALYNAMLAHQCFPFISPTWQPTQSKNTEDARLELEGGGVCPQVVNDPEMYMKRELEVSLLPCTARLTIIG
jgi:hypothetical protein